ncbi:MAG TPA: methionine--tRNA ligase [Chloroflexota bacterium]|nr:methionine--tRNA ligase [Chloroflexota bacterium]
MAEEHYYVTTTIPYVNGKPHIGHALEFAQTDAFGRYHRLRGDTTYVLTGTDENSLTNVLAAESEGIPVRQLVDRNSELFRELADHLNFDYDQFIRTAADPRHAAGAQKLWRAVEAAGDIYKKRYSGLYCTRCEQYYQESELVDGLCPDHLIPLELIEEENYFFRLSRYGDRLHELISSDQLHIIPDFRKREVLSFIERGLEDFSVSRSQERARGWGIEVPGDPSQVMYVWFDALTNYITALDYADDGQLYREFWVNNPDRMHALGKSVIRFHAVYWPGMLLSAGVPLPTREFVHGFINMAGTKMSKSLGNVVDPEDLIQAYGPEAVRYYLLRAVSPVNDSDFSYDAFESRYNADLANDLGNLLNRVVSMVGRYRGGRVPAAVDVDEDVKSIASGLQDAVADAMDRYDPRAAMDAIWVLVTRCNRYVEEAAPWVIAKSERNGEAGAADSLDSVLYTLAEAVRIIGAALEPFLPETAAQIAEQLGVTRERPWPDRQQWGVLEAGISVGAPRPIFPKMETATV